MGPGTVLTVSPFYHFNRAHYIGGSTTDPGNSRRRSRIQLRWRRGFIGINHGSNNAHAGFQVFGERDNQFFAIVTSDGSNPPLSQRQPVWGNVEALFMEDQFKLTTG